jgi:hypothetical protein
VRKIQLQKDVKLHHQHQIHVTKIQMQRDVHHLQNKRKKKKRMRKNWR